MSYQSSPTHKKPFSSTVTKPVTAIVFLVTFFFTYLNAQTIIPAGFGPMSVTQPSRETAVLTGNPQQHWRAEPNGEDPLGR